MESMDLNAPKADESAEIPAAASVPIKTETISMAEESNSTTAATMNAEETETVREEAEEEVTLQKKKRTISAAEGDESSDGEGEGEGEGGERKKKRHKKHKKSKKLKKLKKLRLLTKKSRTTEEGDDQEEEGEHGHEGEEGQEGDEERRRKKKRPAVVQFIDEEASESDDEDFEADDEDASDSSDDEEENEDEDVPNAEDLRFVANDEDDEEEEENDNEPGRRQRRSSGSESGSDDSDIDSDEVAEEVRDLEGAEIASEKTNRKRLKRKTDLEKRHPQGEATAKDLFEKDSADEESGDNDDDDGFIVNDNEEDSAPRPKKKDRENLKAFGVTDPDRAKIQDIFAPVEYYEEDDLQEDVERGESQNLDAIVEPSVLEEKFLTIADELIRLDDTPERMQLQFPNRKAPADGELDREAEWIAEVRLQATTRDNMGLKIAIAKVLRLMREKNVEVPYIAQHMKDQFMNHMNPEDLWKIVDFDANWTVLLNKRSQLQKFYDAIVRDRIRRGDPEPANLYFEEIVNAPVRTDILMNDIYDFFSFEFGAELSEIRNHDPKQEKLRKIPVKKTSTVVSLLREFSRNFGISAKSFGNNLESHYKKNEPNDPKMKPEILVAEFVMEHPSLFSSEQAALSAAKDYVAKEISVDPIVRRFLRDAFHQGARLTVRPTDKGRTEIVNRHLYEPFKYIRGKPVQEIEKEEFVLLAKAEREGLLVLEISGFTEDQFDQSLQSYVSDLSNAVAKAWNALRKEILHLAFKNYLEPLFLKELRAQLLEKGIEYLADQARGFLLRKLLQGPWRPASVMNMEDDNAFRYTGVLSINGGERADNVMGVLLDPNGDVSEILRLTNFKIPMDSTNAASVRAKMQDREELRAFLLRTEPSVVAIGTSNMEAHRLYEDLRTVLRGIFDEFHLEIDLIWVDDEVAKIYKDSERAQKEFPDYPPLVRYCISIGRTTQDPLLEYGGLVGVKNEATRLELSPLQDQIPHDVLQKVVERSFIDAVQAVGVDINDAVRYSHRSYSLQFVSGLGPRKAEALISSIQKSENGRLVLRQDLVEEPYKMGLTIFLNCASFIRICRRHFLLRDGRLSDDVQLEPLDETGIHPEYYQIARTIVNNAVDSQCGKDSSEGVEELIQKNVKERKMLVNMLQLEEYAKELVRSGKGLLNRLVGIIREELIDHGRERRVFVQISDNELGDLLMSKPLRVQPRELDLYYDSNMQRDDENAAKERMQQKRAQRTISRSIVHPYFKQFHYAQAEEYLKEKDVGEFLLRPSGKGLSNITATLKVADHVFWHIVIDELEKSSDLALGKVLKIGEEQFADLDEIIARYLEPVSLFFVEVSKHAKFRPVSEVEVDMLLQQERAKKPGQAAYFLCPSSAHPGRIMFCYLVSSVPKHEPVEVTPRGYKFRYQMSRRFFLKADEFIAWFKRHYADGGMPVLQQHQQQQPPHHHPLPMHHHQHPPPPQFHHPLATR